MKRPILFVCIAVLIMLADSVNAQNQVGFRNKKDSTVRIVDILHADSYNYLKKDSLHESLSLVGHVRLKENQTLFFCDSMILNQKENYIEAFGNVHISDTSSNTGSNVTNIKSQYMKYLVDDKMVYFKNNVSLTDGKANLYTENLQYDMSQKIGTYVNGGKVVNGQSVLTSKEGVYYTDLKDVYFKKNVVLKDPKYDLTTDSLLYNSETQISTFLTDTYIIDSAKRSIRTREGYYDTKQHKAEFGKRATITDAAQTITADNIRTDDTTGISIATGNAIYRDTAQGMVLMGNYMISNKKQNTALATGRPVMILKQDNDSIYVTADTLYSGSLENGDPELILFARRDSLAKIAAEIEAREQDSINALTPDTTKKNPLSPKLINDSLRIIDTASALIVKPDSSVIRPDSTFQKDKALAVTPPVAVRESLPGKDTALAVSVSQKTAGNDSSRRYLMGFHHVRIFSDSLQAVSDSLYYSGKDSIFRLFTNPVMWANGSQVTGDTMYLYTKNKKADRLYVFNNGFAINQVNKIMFDQVRGNTINAYFKNGEVDYMRAKGSAESVYFAKDEHQALTGVNRVSKADIIDVIYKNKELNRVVLRNDVEGTFIPIRKAKTDELQLRNFKWLESRRPKSKEEILHAPDILPVKQTN
jgi:lipopolysaccharide export system protein LptA